MRVLLFFALSLSIMSFGKSRLPLNYTVVSDEYNSEVHKDSTLITGFVYNDTSAVAGAKVSTLNGTVFTYTDNQGRYAFTISSEDTAIFMFKSGLAEIVVWNYPFKGSHQVEMNFYPAFDLMQIEVDKPVIYMYSTQDVTANVRVNFKGDFFFVYPAMKDNSWEVVLSDNQITVEDKPYPYLFWEGKINTVNFDKTDEKLYGTFVKKNDVMIYLERVLTEMGLNNKEKTDFITFWVPNMNEKEWYFIQFLNQEKIDDYFGTLEIQPNPDHLSRVYMLFEGFDLIPEGIESVPQQFEGISREGFAVIEWGGSEIKNGSKREL